MWMPDSTGSLRHEFVTRVRKRGVGERIKIVLVALPDMLRELVEAAVQTEPGVKVIEERRDAAGLERVVARAGARAVVAGAESLDAEDALAVVTTARVRVVTLSADGQAAVYECRPQRRDVGELTPDALMRLLREAE
jgi:hypothetical protein